MGRSTFSSQNQHTGDYGELDVLKSHWIKLEANVGRCFRSDTLYDLYDPNPNIVFVFI